MRVSLQIDGDASGAVKAATDASSAVADLGKQAESSSQPVEDAFKKTADALDALKNKSQASGAANDNAAGSALGLAGKLSQVTASAAGADSALAKGAAGAVSFAQGLGGLVRAGSTLALLGGAIGLAVTIATTFYGIVNSGSGEAAKRLDEQSRLVGVVRDAYRDASKTAGEFYAQSKALTLFQAQQNLAGLEKDLQTKLQPLVRDSNFSSATPNFAEPFGADFAPAAQKVGIFQKAIDDLHTSIAQGKPDFVAYQEAIASIGRTAQGSAPGVAEEAGKLLKAGQDAAAEDLAVRKARAQVALLQGTGTEADRKLLGVASQTEQFDRLTKSMERQSAAQEADAWTAGVSAGEAAKLRAQFVLTEAAQQSGITVAGAYADKIKAISERAGEAAQKLAVANLASQTAFNRDQIGRTAIDASVADQLRGAFGNNADLNSYEAGLVRVNEQMKELKGTTMEVSSGVFRDFRTELQNGTNAWEAFGKAGVNALNRIIDKLADKALDKLISGALGSFLGVGGTGTVANGGIVLGGANGPGVFAAAGGGDFGPGWGVVGEKGPEIIKVHAGGVTVYPHQVSKPYLPGFADGGSLSPWGNVARFPRGGQDNGPAGGAQSLHVTVGVTVDDGGKLQAYVKSVSQQATSDGIAGYAGSPAFIAHVADASNVGKTRGYM